MEINVRRDTCCPIPCHEESLKYQSPHHSLTHPPTLPLSSSAVNCRIKRLSFLIVTRHYYYHHSHLSLSLSLRGCALLHLIYQRERERESTWHGKGEINNGIYTGQHRFVGLREGGPHAPRCTFTDSTGSALRAKRVRISCFSHCYDFS